MLHWNVGIALYVLITTANYFFEKNDMIFPCPALAPAFPLLLVLVLLTGFFFGAGSSSEKDSHVGSSTVTARIR